MQQPIRWEWNLNVEVSDASHYTIAILSDNFIIFRVAVGPLRQPVSYAATRTVTQENVGLYVHTQDVRAASTEPNIYERTPRNTPGNDPLNVHGKVSVTVKHCLRIHTQKRTGERAFKCTWEGQCYS